MSLFFENGVSKNYMINHHFINRIAKFLNLDKPPNHIVCCIISYTIKLYCFHFYPVISRYILQDGRLHTLFLLR